MLKHIPAIIPSALLKTLCEMGHGSRIVLGDGNFPGADIAKKAGVERIELSGHGMCEVLDAILTLLPLDAYVQNPVMLMERMECDKDMPLPIWDEYKRIIAKYDPRGGAAVGYYERFEFYDRAAECCCVVQTGESSGYANIILQKGLVVPE